MVTIHVRSILSNRFDKTIGEDAVSRFTPTVNHLLLPGSGSNYLPSRPANQFQRIASGVAGIGPHRGDARAAAIENKEHMLRFHLFASRQFNLEPIDRDERIQVFIPPITGDKITFYLSVSSPKIDAMPGKKHNDTVIGLASIERFLDGVSDIRAGSLLIVEFDRAESSLLEKRTDRSCIAYRPPQVRAVEIFVNPDNNDFAR